MNDWPAWLIVLVVTEVLLLVVLLALLARGRHWTRLRVGFFAEREFREEETDDSEGDA